ncbi:hypothetical protein ACFSX9_02715 [Flavobacterium ardleyense]|uniref:Uncharacterized protein n=1 Tax=Flavobacterium ardleyense TaxID=2038737 RepID=A0ABW5Z6F1_9FLAO
MNFRNIIIEQIFQKYKDTYSRISASFEDFKQTTIYTEFPNATLGESIDIKSDLNTIKVFFVTTNSSLTFTTEANSVKYNFDDEFCICAFVLNEDYGKSQITSKYFIDEVVDFFVNTDIKFKNFPQFNSKYSCSSLNNNEFQAKISKEIVDLFVAFDKDLTVEFNDRRCFIKTKRPIRYLRTNLEIIEFSFKLKSVLNNKIH